MIFLDKLVFSRHKMFEDWCICDQGRIYVPAATNPSRTHLIYPKAMLVLLKTDCVQMVPSCSRARNRFFNRPRLERGSRKSPEQLLKSIKVSRLWSLKQVRFRDLLPIKREHPPLLCYVHAYMNTFMLSCFTSLWIDCYFTSDRDLSYCGIHKITSLYLYIYFFFHCIKYHYINSIIESCDSCFKIVNHARG